VKRFASHVLLIAGSLFYVGCNNSGYPYKAQIPPASAYYQPVQTAASAPTPVPEVQTKKVEIISEPAGARIEINDNYIGDAPITVEIPQDQGYFKATTTIRALPTEAGDYVQTKYFDGADSQST
jgi:PEGA domain